MKITKNFYTGLAFTGLFVLMFLMFAALSQSAHSAANVPAPSNQYNLPVTLLSATTTNATSTNLAAGGGQLVIAGAKKVVMYFQRGGTVSPNLGTTTFKVQGSPDGVNWYGFGLFKQATSTTVNSLVFTSDGINSTITLGAGTGNATSTIPVALDLTNFGFYSLRCISVVTTDGEATCAASVTY